MYVTSCILLDLFVCRFVCRVRGLQKFIEDNSFWKIDIVVQFALCRVRSTVAPSNKYKSQIASANDYHSCRL